MLPRDQDLLCLARDGRNRCTRVRRDVYVRWTCPSLDFQWPYNTDKCIRLDDWTRLMEILLSSHSLDRFQAHGGPREGGDEGGIGEHPLPFQHSLCKKICRELRKLPFSRDIILGIVNVFLCIERTVYCPRERILVLTTGR